MKAKTWRETGGSRVSGGWAVPTPLPLPAPCPAGGHHGPAAPPALILAVQAPSWVPAPTLLGTRVLLNLAESRLAPSLSWVLSPLLSPCPSQSGLRRCPHVPLVAQASAPSACSSAPRERSGGPSALSGPDWTTELSSLASPARGARDPHLTSLPDRNQPDASLPPRPRPKPSPNSSACTASSSPYAHFSLVSAAVVLHQDFSWPRPACLDSLSPSNLSQEEAVIALLLSRLKLCEESLLPRIEATAFNRPSRPG